MSISHTSYSNIENTKFDTVIVGAGPVGLLTAISMWALDKNRKILILDRYAEYKRTNPLQLERSSFEIGKNVPEIKALINELFTKNGKLLKTVKIPTNIIEEKLLKIVNDHKISHHIFGGIELRRGADSTVSDLDTFSNQFQTAKLIIGADGAKSRMRKNLFGNDTLSQQENTEKTKEDLDAVGLKEDTGLQYIAQVTYPTNNAKPKKTSFIKKWFHMKSLGTSLIEIPKSVSKGEDKKGEMNLLFTVSQKTYQKIQDATFKDKKSLRYYQDIKKGNSKRPNSLIKKAIAWITRRADIAERQKIEDSKIVSIRLNVYRSKKFIKIQNEKAYALVGDAAFGVPYFRSLNNGIMCALQLAQSVTQVKNPDDIKNNLKIYNGYVTRLANWEIFKAKVKGFFIRALNRYINITGWLPRKLKIKFKTFFSSAIEEYQPLGTPVKRSKD